MPSRLTAVKLEVAILGADQKERGLWGRERNVANLKEHNHVFAHAQDFDFWIGCEFKDVGMVV